MGPKEAPPKGNGPAAQPLSAFEKYRWPAIGLIAVAVVVAATMASRSRAPKTQPAPIDGYEREAAVVEAEYRKFHGRLLRDPDLEQQFRMAAELVSRQNYQGAIGLLEPVAKQAAVPVIFHDLGILYAATGDRARAILAFREALARDPEYHLVRDSIERLKWLGNEADPMKREIEPNNNTLIANLIGVGSPVEGELTPGDTDTFKFITPPAPRDIVELQIENVAQSIEFGLRIVDDSPRNESATLNAGPGAPVNRFIAQPPNTPLYLQIWGAHNSSGPYRLSLRGMKAYDAYEPNDDVFSARRIELGQKIEANIMDSEDTDFYSFQTTRPGTLTVQLENGSSTLIPAVTTYNSERRSTSFAADVRTPGANLRTTIEVQAFQTYYVQVWPQARTFGKYTLTIQ